MDPRFPPTWWQRPEPVYRIVAPVVAVLVRCLVRLRALHLDRLPAYGPAIVAANHVSHVDPLVLIAVLLRRGRRGRFLALTDLFDQRVVGWFLRAGRMIPVQRGGGVERMVADACAALDAAEIVVVYPEGRLVGRGDRAVAKPGAGLLALRSGVPVVPVGITGLWPRREGAWLPRWRSVVTVVAGEPLDLGRWDGRDDLVAQSEVAAAMLSAIRELSGDRFPSG